MVFQDPLTALHPMMNIGRQLTEHVRRHLGLSKEAALERAAGLLADVRIPDPEGALVSFPHQFSGGMRQRIAIAAALACEPKLIVADEPTTALDVTVQAGILRLLDDLRREKGLSVILITHDLGVMSSIADRVSVMYAGRVVEVGAARPRAPRAAPPVHEGAAARAAEAGVVEGEPARLDPGCAAVANAVPSGCAFHPRCEFAIASCTTEVPPLIRHGDRRSRVPSTRSGRPHEPARAPGRRGHLRPAGPRAGARRRRSQPLARAGQIVGLVGESGCGKSTLAKAVVGLVPASAGRILFEGREVGPLTRRARPRDLVRLQMVFQNPFSSLNPRRTIGAQLAEAMLAAGFTRRAGRGRVTELLELVGLSAGAAERYPHQFSGGQRQRIAVARALAAEPSVIVLDEPLSSLDASAQAQLANVLVDLARSSRSASC